LRALEEIGDGASLEEVSALIDRKIADAGLPEMKEAPAGVLASGGNADALAALAGASETETGLRYLPLERLRELTATLAALPCEERMRRFDLRADRADVIVPAGVL